MRPINGDAGYSHNERTSTMCGIGNYGAASEFHEARQDFREARQETREAKQHFAEAREQFSEARQDFAHGGSLGRL